MSIRKSLDQFAEKLNSDPRMHFNKVVRLTEILTSHIDGKIKLSESKIQDHVEELINYALVSGIPLKQNMPVIRAVRFNENIGFSYTDTSRLSYIPTHKPELCKKGRVNVEGQSLFYACFGNGSDEKAISTMLSECRAEKGYIFNVLVAEIDSPFLNLVPIGINDYFRRGVKEPFGLSSEFIENYEYLISILEHESKLTVNLCEAFLSSVMSKNGSTTLYDVTSSVTNAYLKFEAVHGVLYPSTMNIGYPNVAIKPLAVDHFIKYKEAVSFLVEDALGYGLFQVNNLGCGVLVGDLIEWSQEP
ncbi:hypothetical protein [Vibrio splendidus]|uniref:hypothetical protein n=1 Tax=Vibrio splendidus TaxID=29497 RepID=UPI0011B28203|nr:hypothetical protein [Vibrio splendidus]